MVGSNGGIIFVFPVFRNSISVKQIIICSLFISIKENRKKKLKLTILAAIIFDVVTLFSVGWRETTDLQCRFSEKEILLTAVHFRI